MTGRKSDKHIAASTRYSSLTALPAAGAAVFPAVGGSIHRLIAKSARILRNDGLAALLRYLRAVVFVRLHSKVFDHLCVDEEPATVSQITQIHSLTIAGDHRADSVEYAPTPYMVIRWMQSLLPEDVANWSFVDIGVGRGRVISAAARQPYRLVVGIEHATELRRDALRNITGMPAEARMAHKVDVINTDAATFEIPDGPCIIYLFNPFGVRVLRKFLANVIASQQKRPRRILVAYYNPVHADVMTEFQQITKCELPLKARMRFATLSPYGFELYEISAMGLGKELSSTRPRIEEETL